MTQTERNRFTILIVTLIVLVVGGILLGRFRSKTEVGADILGVIQNQAVATYTDADGVAMQPSLSDISQVTVSGGVGNVTINYNLGKRANQSAKLDVQFYKANEDVPLVTFNDKNGDQGSIVTKLKNVPNGQYDVSIKPVSYLSQVVKNFNFANGKANIVDFAEPFPWGDIDVSHNNKGDNKVNNADWAVFIKSWNTPEEKADYNGDGIVNNADAVVLLNNWNKQGQRFDINQINAVETPVPEL